jgi:hypothetical protein
MTGLMALIAIDAVVYVARDGVMLEIVGVIVSVTPGALKDRIVI